VKAAPRVSTFTENDRGCKPAMESTIAESGITGNNGRLGDPNRVGYVCYFSVFSFCDRMFLFVFTKF